eukprot:scaffold82889_cov48-Phaeocystis_antarctica.AAC.2
MLCVRQPLPYRPAGDFRRWATYLQSKLTYDIYVDMLARAPHAYVRIPPRQSGAVRPCSTLPGGARQGLIVGYALQFCETSTGKTT